MWRHASIAEMAKKNKLAAPRARRSNAASAPSLSAAEAVKAARDLAWTGQHAQAIEAASTALAAPACDDASRLALLDLRVESFVAQGEVDRAREDAEAMLAIAERSGEAGLRAQALNCLTRVQLSSGDFDAAVKVAGRAVMVARRSRKKPLVALCLSNLAAAQMRLRQSAAAVENATAAAQLFEVLGEERERGRALWVIACAQDDLGH